VNVLENVTIAPLARETDRLYACPADDCCVPQYCPAVPTAVVVRVVGVPVAGIRVTPMVRVQDTPEYEIVRLVPVLTAAVPVFVNESVPEVLLALKSA
jgi:hypothetical protein